uniref:Putative lian-aa1 retrotransposon protein n=1 Tax=Panstrongylus lignarius TaxID=156445 RepID=A0A224XRM2_9HEMI
MRVLVGVLTGHALVASHLHKMGRTSSSICQNCDEEVRETVYHYLCQCPRFASIRFCTFGRGLLLRETLGSLELKDILSFCRQTGRLLGEIS